MKKNVRMEDLMPIFREQLGNGGKVQFAPSGVSMRPMLDDKADQVFIEHADKENIRKWDVVLFQNYNGAYIMHRVMKLDEEGFITRGDNCYYNDKKQPYSSLIGKIYKFEHKGKMHSADDLLYMLYVRVWVGIYLPRKLIYKIKRKINRILKNKGK